MSAEILLESWVSTREAQEEAQGVPLAAEGADFLLTFPHL